MLSRIAHLTWRLARFIRHWLKEIFIALVLAVLAAVLVEYYKASKERESLNRNRRAVAQVVAYKNEHQLAQGSGVFINQTGLLITNFHVIEGADQLVAKLPTGAYYQLRDIRGADKVADIAILQFDAQETPCVSGLGDSDKVEAGQRIITIGSPLGLESSISEGVISNPKRSIAGVNFIQFTAPISSGSSGGGLFDAAGGFLLGLPSRSLAAPPELQADVGVQNVNFAVPINAVKDSISGTTTIFTEGRPEYYYSLGTIAENRHALDEATTLYKRAIELDGKYVDAYMGLGSVYYEKGDYEQEVANYGKAADLDPGNYDAQYYLARIIHEFAESTIG